MKKTLLVTASLVFVMTILRTVSFGVGEGQRERAKEASLAKETVTKVLTEHLFTPPVSLEGPSGSVWYVASRSPSSHSAEQAIVGVRGGGNFTVELVAFHRDREQDAWQPVAKSSAAAIANAERTIREQLQKELAKEEKAK